MAYLNYCNGNNLCIKYYSRIISKITQIIGVQNLQKINKLRTQGRYPIRCDSIFDWNLMDFEDMKKSQKIIDLFQKFTKEFEESVDNEK